VRPPGAVQEAHRQILPASASDSALRVPGRSGQTQGRPRPSRASRISPVNMASGPFARRCRNINFGRLSATCWANEAVAVARGAASFQLGNPTAKIRCRTARAVQNQSASRHLTLRIFWPRVLRPLIADSSPPPCAFAARAKKGHSCGNWTGPRQAPVSGLVNWPDRRPIRGSVATWIVAIAVELPPYVHWKYLPVSSAGFRTLPV